MMPQARDMMTASSQVLSSISRGGIDAHHHMKKAPETTTMRDYAFTAINKYWAMKFISFSTAQYSQTDVYFFFCSS
jgi:hypothetical protein